tara:strand:- start:137480 stop:138295 length:816 start_codon:yes stop_codon:yes gene_type:complete
MTKIKSFLKLGVYILILFILLSFSCSNQKMVVENTELLANNKFVMLSIEMIDAVKNKKNTDRLKARYEKLNADTLAKYLKTESQKKAFWINTYNAYIQILLTENSELFEDRGNFFGKPRIIIAHRKLSFDDIEHGIIRGSKMKLSLGLLRNPFTGDFEKKLRTKNEDGRIHFVLNCGAKSCPLISTYDAKTFESKLDKVAKCFLHQVSTYDKANNSVLTTPLFSWFRGDFEGKNGMLKLLKQYEVIPEESKPKITYDTYDWTLNLGNFYRE